MHGHDPLARVGRNGQRYDAEWCWWGEGPDEGRVILRVPRGAELPPGFETLLDATIGKLVEPGELDSWYRSRWYFTWQGKTFVASKIEDGVITGTMLGPDQHFAEDNGLTTIERGWCIGSFPLDETQDLHEERRDRLAKWRGEQQSSG